ncbi:MAG: SDR family oxidoreductase, partial [Rhizobiales bacterium]|nr:SDR family oxidoreductase [Hyphomicrobiales bacterium]
GRLCTVDDVADAVLYLCEPRSAHITGHTLPVDGGWTVYGFV